MLTITNEEALNLLMDRLETWTNDKDVQNLFEKMYKNYIEEGVFDGNTSTVMEIVDNDYINYCEVVYAEDLSQKDLKKLVKLYKNGERDISFESFDSIGYSFIEAVDNEENPTKFLLRA